MDALTTGDSLPPCGEGCCKWYGASFSLPPCGGGSGWGVGRFVHGGATFADPHPRPLPSRNRVYAGFGPLIE